MPPPRLTPGRIALLVVGFLLLRASLFAVTTAGEYALYLRYAAATRDTSLADLHRSQDIEYPQLATLFGVGVLYAAEVLPAWTEHLTDWRPNPTKGPLPARYEVALGLVLFAVDLGCMGLVYLIARQIYPGESPARRVGRLGVYVAATTAIGLIIYDRQDLVVALAALLALAAFARGWSVLAYAVLTAGVAYKLVPLMLVPLWVFAAATMRAAPCPTGRFLRAVVLESVVAGAILLLYPLLAYLTCGGERAFVFLTFHSARGLQVEAQCAWPIFLIDPHAYVFHSYGSFCIRSDLADRLAKVSTLVTMLATAGSVLVAGRGFWRVATSGRRPDRNELVTHLVAGSLLVWLAFILFGKVASPQYMLWLGPLVPLLPFRGQDRWWLLVMLAGMVFTTLVFPCQYLQALGQPNEDDTAWAGPTPVGFVLLAAKSGFVAASFVWLLVLVWRGAWLSTANPHSPEVV
jgi:hypothetical protein